MQSLWYKKTNGWYSKAPLGMADRTGYEIEKHRSQEKGIGGM